LYGTTTIGGANGSDGTVFQITLDGSLIVLHSFDRHKEGFYPVGLVQASDGNLYGTTQHGLVKSPPEGKVPFGAGTVFKITPQGSLTTLYLFSGELDGSNPCAGLLQANDGNLYGTTSKGGANDLGTVFRMNLDGTLTTLHSFRAQLSSNCDGS